MVRRVRVVLLLEAPLRLEAAPPTPETVDDRSDSCRPAAERRVVRDPLERSENSERARTVLARLLASSPRHAQLLGLPGCGGPSGKSLNQRSTSPLRALDRLLLACEDTLSVSGSSERISE
ncbi:hypothetical protein Busp01_33440 [Trinickia caryophylli]|nr:hypothetical protein C0Z17_02060 [Trinickia caryophylli]GLU33502.1 hypothetical protein Busp01_33440 [Trinickia caryophylli]